MNLSNTEPKRRDNEIPFIFRNFVCVYAEYLFKYLNGPNPLIIKIKRYRCVSKNLDPALLLLNLIAILRIETWGFWYQCSIAGNIFCSYWSDGENSHRFRVNWHSYSLVSHWVSVTWSVRSTFYLKWGTKYFFIRLHSKASMLRDFKNTNSQENSAKKWKIHSEDID